MCSVTVSTSASKDALFGVSNRSIAVASQCGLNVFCSSSDFPTPMRNKNKKDQTPAIVFEHFCNGKKPKPKKSEHKYKYIYME